MGEGLSQDAFLTARDDLPREGFERALLCIGLEFAYDFSLALRLDGLPRLVDQTGGVLAILFQLFAFVLRNLSRLSSLTYVFQYAFPSLGHQLVKAVVARRRRGTLLTVGPCGLLSLPLSQLHLHSLCLFVSNRLALHLVRGLSIICTLA